MAETLFRKVDVKSNVQTSDEIHFMRILLAGDSGAGKSYAGTSFPDVFIIDTDKRLSRLAKIRTFDKYTIDAYDKAYLEVMEVLKAFKLKEEWTKKYKTLFLDSLTALADLMEMELVKYPREAKGDGTQETMSLPDYNVHHRRMVNVWRYLQDLEINTVASVNTVLEKDDVRGTLVEMPMLTGKKEPKQIAKFFDEVYYLEYNSDKQYVAYTKPQRFFKSVKTGYEKMPEKIVNPVYENLSKYYEIPEAVPAVS